jgi:hypothetical protein
VFLLAAQRAIETHLVSRGVKVDARLRARIAARCLVGIDNDPGALAVAQLALRQATGGTQFDLRLGDALDDAVWNRQKVDVVVGNPPWGQKRLRFAPAAAARLRKKFRTARGPLDPFKLFVEQAITWTRIGGRWGFILPDIVLLKNHQVVRDLILESTEIETIAHAGRAFPDVNLDVVLLSGRRVAAPRARHSMRVETPVGARPRSLLLNSFLEQPEHRFNLYLSRADEALLRRLRRFPRLGDQFAMHEGVHSGNVRDKLFLPKKPRGPAAPLILGGKEIARHRLSWAGAYLNLDPNVIDKGAGDYANLGRPEWHERPKIVVRRTGDRLVAAYDPIGRYVSNNLFVLFPKEERGEDFQRAVVAILLSPLHTWYFRTVQPRTGRLFAELKLIHLRDMPLPPLDAKSIRRLARWNRAGDDPQIAEEVADLFDLSMAERRLVCAKIGA